MTYQYNRRAHYHETDQMGIIHHTNYIKWFEEARIALMSEIGVPYSTMEEEGIISPVLHVSCDYKRMVRFDQEIIVNLAITSYNSIKFSVTYDVTNLKGDITYVEGYSNHCFLNRQLRPVSLKKAAPQMHKAFYGALTEEI